MVASFCGLATFCILHANALQISANDKNTTKLFDRLRDMKDALRWRQQLKLKLKQDETRKQHVKKKKKMRRIHCIAWLSVMFNRCTIFIHHFYRVWVLCFKLSHSFHATWVNGFGIKRLCSPLFDRNIHFYSTNHHINHKRTLYSYKIRNGCGIFNQMRVKN